MPKKKKQVRRKPHPTLVSRRLVELRQRFGLSQRSAATKCGLKSQQWNRWETGARQPYFDDLEKVAKVFGTTVDLVFRDET